MNTALHQALLDIASYPGEDGPVSCIETHISRLYFTRDHVYKIKKPVDFGFLDFTTLARRRHYCREEVRLNSRLSPEVYLGVAAIRRRNGRFGVELPGTTVDYAVRMKRLPAACMLAALIDRDDAGLPAAITAVAERLAAFHAALPAPVETGGADLARIRTNWQENFDQLDSFIGDTLSAAAQALLRARVRRLLDDHHPLLLERQRQGWVREGHGDLHAENICIIEPIAFFDCIEFNRRFRLADVLADLAFLLMDLDDRGRRDLSARLLAGYRYRFDAVKGQERLLSFYLLYRAVVRGKIQSFLAREEGLDPERRQRCRGNARRYFNLALGYLAPPVLVLTCGLMGVGKSTLARALGSALGAEVLRSDRVRKELAGSAAATGAEAAFGEGIYTAGFTERTYGRLLAAAGDLLRTGTAVIVDASFAAPDRRRDFLQAAASHGVGGFVLHLRCDRETLLARLAGRRQRGEELSDGRPELLAPQEEAFSPPSPAEPVITVDTSGDVDYNVQLVLCQLLERTGPRP